MDDPRTARQEIRLTHSERARLRALAEHDGVTVSDYVRDAVAHYAAAKG